MILMPELCYYCREELNFGDMTLHDGHRVHKKCLPPINEFKQAARKAADTVFDWYDDPDEEDRVTPEFAIPILQKKIQDDFAEIEAVHGKLVELAVWCAKTVDYTDPEADYDEFKKIMDDPLVQKAIERSE